MSAAAVGLLLHALPEPHLLVSARGEILAANPAACRLLGLRNGPMGTLLQQVSDPEERVHAYLRACSRSTSPLPGALSFQTPTGRTVRLRCKGARLRAADSPAVLVLHLNPPDTSSGSFRLLAEKVEALTREVRERKRAEAELRETAARLESTVRASPLAIIGVDARCRVIVWNPAAEAMFGWRAAEVLGRPLPIVPQEERADFQRRWSLVQQGRELISLPGRRMRKDGSTLEVSISSAPLLGHDGDVLGAIVVIEDISERLRAEETLRESEAFTQRLLASSGDCIWVLDLDGRLLSINQAGQQMLGAGDPSVLLGSDWLALWKGDDHLAARHALEVARSGGEGRFQGFAPTRSGQPRWWDVVITPVPDAAGRPFRLLAISRDVTVQKEAAEDLRRARDAAEEASQAKGQFLAIMSHELRTPLNGIIGYADLLESGVWGPTTELQNVQIGRIKASAWHLVSVIEEILTFSRVDAGREDVHLQPTDPVGVTREVMELLEPQAAAKGLRLRLDAPATPLQIETDAGKLRQIILNLLGNAVKFTDAGEVRVSLAREAGQLLLRVRDTGPGIAPDQLESIFEAFTQVDQTLTRVKDGTGLGLSICRRLAQLLGGEVTVEGSTPGEGSTFLVRLPAPVQPVTEVRPPLPLPA